MKKIIVLCLSLFFIVTSYALPIVHWQTKNGAQVYFIASPGVPMLNIRLQFNAGSIFDGQTFGLAALTNSLIGESTKTLSGSEINNQFAEVGAQFDQDVDQDFSLVNLTILTQDKYLQPALNLFNQVLTQFDFDTNTMNRVKNQIGVLLQQQNQQPDQVAQQIFYKNLYQTLPYAHPVFGNVKSIQAITMQQIKQFYQQYYTANNLNVLMVGALSLEQAKKVAEKITQGLPEGNKAQINFHEERLATNKIVTVDFPANQSYVVLGNFVSSLTSADRYPLFVANYLLGGSSLTSRLFENVREKHGLTYSINSQLIPSKGLQPFMITLQSKKAEVQKALAITHQTLNNFTLTEQELDKVKQQLIDVYPLTMDSNSKLIEKLNLIVGYGLPLNSMEMFAKNIQAVTLPQVNLAIQSYFINAPMLTVIVGGKND